VNNNAFIFYALDGLVNPDLTNPRVVMQIESNQLTNQANIAIGSVQIRNNLNF